MKGIVKKGLDWSRGLTKDTDERIKRQSESIRKGYRNGRIVWNKGKKGG